MTHGSLFSGIGGFDLAADWMGWENKFHCEWNEFGQKILKYYWPEAVTYGGITKTDFTIWRGKIDILTGGFPCQPYSLAGKRKGKEDERHLWPEMLRAIREIKPRWVLGENVYGLVNWNGGLVFEEVCTDLEAEGYEVQPIILPASAVNAPHRRDRVWFVAYRNSDGQSRNKEFKKRFEHFRRGPAFSDPNPHVSSRDATNSNKERFQRRPKTRNTENRTGGGDSEKIKSERCGKRTSWEEFPNESPICTRDDGLSEQLDRITFSKFRIQSIKGAGNAIVPQVALEIFKVIEQIESEPII